MFNKARIGNSGDPLESSRLRSNSYVLHGIGGSALLTIAYFSIVSIAESFDHATSQFFWLAYLLVPLVASFGIQIALLSYSRQQSKAMQKNRMGATTSGGMSTASMVACCAHHITDVAAFTGLTAVTLFLSTYQTAFILIGILSNTVGIFTILIFVQKNKLFKQNGILAKPMRLNMTKARRIAVVIGLIIVVGAFAWIAFNAQPTANAGDVGIKSLQPKTSIQNGLTIEAAPQPFTFGDSVKIDLTLDTHGGDLGLDLTKAAKLQDSNGTTYEPTAWTGPSLGGHHGSGTLVFPPLNGEPPSMKLSLTDVYGADWTFEWNLG